VKSGLALSAVGARNDILSMEINSTGTYADVILTTANSQTLLQCGIEGVVLYGLHFRDLNDDDDNEWLSRITVKEMG